MPSTQLELTTRLASERIKGCIYGYSNASLPPQREFLRGEIERQLKTVTDVMGVTPAQMHAALRANPILPPPGVSRQALAQSVGSLSRGFGAGGQELAKLFDAATSALPRSSFDPEAFRTKHGAWCGLTKLCESYCTSKADVSDPMRVEAKRERVSLYQKKVRIAGKELCDMAELAASEGINGPFDFACISAEVQKKISRLAALQQGMEAEICRARVNRRVAGNAAPQAQAADEDVFHDAQEVIEPDAPRADGPGPHVLRLSVSLADHPNACFAASATELFLNFGQAGGPGVTRRHPIAGGAPANLTNLTLAGSAMDHHLGTTAILSRETKEVAIVQQRPTGGVGITIMPHHVGNAQQIGAYGDTVVVANATGGMEIFAKRQTMRSLGTFVGHVSGISKLAVGTKFFASAGVPPPDQPHEPRTVKFWSNARLPDTGRFSRRGIPDGTWRAPSAVAFMVADGNYFYVNCEGSTSIIRLEASRNEIGKFYTSASEQGLFTAPGPITALGASSGTVAAAQGGNVLVWSCWGEKKYSIQDTVDMIVPSRQWIVTHCSKKNAIDVYA